jgi:hypothetical protein
LASDPVSAMLTLVAAAGAWPILACTHLHLTQSPLDRALAQAICGSHAFGGGEILGHCPACYAGLAVFLGAATALSQRLRVAAQAAR